MDGLNRGRAAFAVVALCLGSAAQGQEAPAANPAAGQDPIVLIDRKASEEGIFRFDYGVPSSPSLNLLGQPEDKVTVVNGLKPFIIQLPQLLANGEDGQSFGIDIAAAWLLGDPQRGTYDQYVDGSSFTRILYRTHVGASLYEGVADTDPTKALASRIAVGISTSLLDGSDPLMAKLNPDDDKSAWRKCLDRGAATMREELGRMTAGDVQAHNRNQREYRRLFDRRAQLDREIAQLQANPTDPVRLREAEAEVADVRATMAELDREIRDYVSGARTALQEAWKDSEASKVIPACTREANLVAQYGQSLNLGFGALWDGVPGKLKGFNSSGWVGWASYRRPLGIRFKRDEEGELKPTGYWMIGFSGRASVDEVVATGDAATPQVKANVFDGWAGLERLTPSSRLGLQIGYQIRDTEGRLASFDRNRLRYFASYSQRLGGEKSGMWLQVGYGHVRSSDDDDEALAVSLIFAPPDAANLFGTN